MSRRTMLVIYVISFAIFCGSLLWRYYEDEKSREYTFVYTTESKKTSTSVTEYSSTTASNTITKATTVTTTVTTTANTEPLYIDINTADAEELCRLDGIGDKLSAAIIRYREENGGFNNIEEIMNVHGIGEGIFGNICDFIYVEYPIYPDDDSDDVSDEPENIEIYEPDEEFPAEEEMPTEPELTLEEVAPIDLNEADLDLFMLLPYVDETIAEMIIALRESIHGFSHPYELLYVEELSEEKVAEIIKYVCVNKTDDNISE